MELYGNLIESCQPTSKDIVSERQQLCNADTCMRTFLGLSEYETGFHPVRRSYRLAKFHSPNSSTLSN